MAGTSQQNLDAKIIPSSPQPASGAPAVEQWPWDRAGLCSDGDFQVKPLFAAKSVTTGGF